MPDYEVVWDGTSRRYLSPALQDATPAPSPHTPSQTALDNAGWLCGQHLRGYDLPRSRLVSSLLAARWPFTVSDLAAASEVSPTRARDFVREERLRGVVRLTGVTDRRTRQAVYERV